MNLGKFIKELKRRNVFKVATAYAIAGWLIIQVAATVAPQLNFPEWVPSFITLAVLCGFPIALIIAWAFELTPEGLKKTDSVETSQEFNTEKSKKINKTLITVLSLAIIFLLVERVFFANSYSSDEDYGQASIAVLPFVNMSNDQANEYFSDGLSEELLNGLAQIEGMQVAGRTSSFSFKGKNEDIRKIADQLNVEHVLEGSVRKDGDKIRITAQLIQADNGFHLWSETYDRELASVFEIQEEISRKVITELKSRILPEEEKLLSALPTKSTEAYDLFLKATQIETTRQPKDLQKAIDLYKEAIVLDSEFGLAHSRLAITYHLLHNYGNLRLEESLNLMDSHIAKAKTIGKDIGMAYLAEGIMHYSNPIEANGIKSTKAFETAIKYLPNNAYLYNWLYLNTNFRFNNIEKAKPYLLKAYELDPLNPPVASNMTGYYIYDQKDYEKANAIIDQIIEAYPNYDGIYNGKLALAIEAPFGDLLGGFKILHEALKKKPKSPLLLGHMTDLAQALDMVPYSKQFVEKLQLLYPNNFESNGRFINLNFLEGNYDSNITILNSYVDRFGDIAKKGIAETLAQNYLLEGKFDKGIAYLEENFPELKGTDLVLNEKTVVGNVYDLSNLTLLYIRLKKEKDRNVDATHQIGQLKNYRKIDSLETLAFENLKEMEIERLVDYYGITENVDKMLELQERNFFERKAKDKMYSFITGNYSYNLHDDNPKVKAFTKRVFEDIHNMRDEVITYLKDQGEWDEFFE